MSVRGQIEGIGKAIGGIGEGLWASAKAVPEMLSGGAKAGTTAGRVVTAPFRWGLEASLAVMRAPLEVAKWGTKGMPQLVALAGLGAGAYYGGKALFGKREAPEVPLNEQGFANPRSMIDENPQLNAAYEQQYNQYPQRVSAGGYDYPVGPTIGNTQIQAGDAAQHLGTGAPAQQQGLNA